MVIGQNKTQTVNCARFGGPRSMLSYFLLVMMMMTTKVRFSFTQFNVILLTPEIIS